MKALKVRFSREVLNRMVPALICAGLGGAIFRLCWALKEMDIGMLLFYLSVPKDPVANYSVVFSTALQCLLFAAAAVLVVLLLLHFLSARRQRAAGSAKRRLRLFGRYAYKRIVAFCCVGLLVGSVVTLACAVELPQYLAAADETTTIYEDAYVDPAAQQYRFPEKKRNLIHIYMESMETTCMDGAHGGQWAENVLPGLSALAAENPSFTGFHAVSGMDWTIGALVAQTSGLPLTLPLTLGGQEEDSGAFLPGACTMGDILADAGYRQVFLCGSDAGFAGRADYFSQHGGYRVWDYNTAIATGRIPEDYYEFWGFEDAKLYDYAKDQLLELAAGDRPFNLTMLTVDTHFYDGYLCPLCGDGFDSQYENVLACADCQVTAFLQWLQTQDFYEDTTVVITGDHLCMDDDFYSLRGADKADRRIYSCFLNAYGGQRDCEKDRELCALDIFPTTLSAMGVTWDGSRLGLGVSLFSGEPTLTETYGAQGLGAELQKKSDYYVQHFLD